MSKGQPHAVDNVAKKGPKISVLAIVVLGHDREGHSEEDHLDEVVELEDIQVDDNVLDHCHDVTELLNDLHQLKGFGETEQDLKDDDALRREHLDSDLLLEKDIDESEEDVGDVQVIPGRRKVLKRSHLLELVELKDQGND